MNVLDSLRDSEEGALCLKNGGNCVSHKVQLRDDTSESSSLIATKTAGYFDWKRLAHFPTTGFKVGADGGYLRGESVVSR